MPTLLKSFESSGDSDSPIGDLGGDEYNLAQSFTLDDTANVGSLELYLRKVNTISSAITVRIETSAAGPKPSGTLANASATTTITPSNTSYAWVTVTFPAGFSLTGGTKYWIVCTVPAAQSTNNHYDWLRNALGGLYASHGQGVQVNLGAWGNEDNAANCYFRVYNNLVVVDVSETLTFVDTTYKKVIKSFSENLTFVSSFVVSTGVVFVHTLTETLTFSDSMRRILNGFLVSIWGKVSKAAATSWSRISKAAPITWTRQGRS